MKSSELIESIVCSNEIDSSLNLSEEVLSFVKKLKDNDVYFPDTFSQLDISTSNTQTGIELGDSFYGFKQHKRCFYKKIGCTWFAFKGISIAYNIDSKNSESILYSSKMQEEIYHFAELEHEIPYGMTVQACIEDYESPLEFIKDHVELKSEVPLVPYPLLVYRLKKDYPAVLKNKEYIQSQAPESSKHLLEEYYFKQDLGIYVYILRGTPLRIGHLSNIPISRSQELFDLVFSSVTCMLKLGYIPCKLENTLGNHNAFVWGKNKGMSIAPWNITLDGAILDFNSVKHIKKYQQVKQIKYDIQLTVQWLVKLILWLDTKYSYLLPKIQRSWIYDEKGLYNESVIYIHQVLFSKLKLELSKESEISKYVFDFFNSDSLFEEVRLLSV
jgi:hypothetical protein